MSLRRSIALVSVFTVAFVLGCEPTPAPGKRAGNAVPEIAGEDVDGKPIKLSDYRGKAVLVSFWGTWCAPCRAMLPHEREMVQRTYRNKPFVFLGVAMDSADTLKDFAKNNPLPWPNIVDGSRTISREWNIEYVPSALLVDHKGVIRKVWMAGFSPDEVWAEVAKAVADAQSE